MPKSGNLDFFFNRNQCLCLCRDWPKIKPVLWHKRSSPGGKKRALWGVECVVISGYRYYSAQLGRWLTKDPIEEKGGLNLYAFVLNNPITLWDVLGRWVHPDGIISAEDAVSNVLNIEKSYFHTGISRALGLTIDPVTKGIGLLKYLGQVVFNTDNIDGSTNKWLFTCKYGWIDLGHFFNSAWIASKFPVLGSSILYTGSISVEMIQAAKQIAFEIRTPPYRGSPSGESAFTAEDLNSNYQGFHFEHDYFGTIGKSFKSFLRDAGAVIVPLGPSVVRAVLEDDVRSLLGRDSSGNLSVYTGRRFLTREGQLKYQRDTFKAFCILCEGESAKEQYRY